MTNFLPTAHLLAHRIAPELAAAPLYLLDSRRAEPAGLGWPEFYGQALAVALPPQLILEIPDYRGPGPVILMNLAGIEAAARPGGAERAAWGVFLHELAHCLPAAPVIEGQPGQAEFYALKLAIERDAPAPPADSAEDVHDLAFVRRCLHLYHRATAAGWDVDWRDVHATGFGDDWVAYLAATEPEARVMAAATFAQIEETPTPPALLRTRDADRAYLGRLGGRA